jgi:hypothetical protein
VNAADIRDLIRLELMPHFGQDPDLANALARALGGKGVRLLRHSLNQRAGRLRWKNARQAEA